MKVTESAPLFSNYVDDKSKQVPLDQFYSSFGGVTNSRSTNTRNQQKSLTSMKDYSSKIIYIVGSLL